MIRELVTRPISALVALVELPATVQRSLRQANELMESSRRQLEAMQRQTEEALHEAERMNQMLSRVVKLTEPLEYAQRGSEYFGGRLKRAIFGEESPMAPSGPPLSGEAPRDETDSADPTDGAAAGDGAGAADEGAVSEKVDEAAERLEQVVEGAEQAATHAERAALEAEDAADRAEDEAENAADHADDATGTWRPKGTGAPDPTPRIDPNQPPPGEPDRLR